MLVYAASTHMVKALYVLYIAVRPKFLSRTTSVLAFLSVQLCAIGNFQWCTSAIISEVKKGPVVNIVQ